MSRLSWECACTFTNDVDAVFCSCCDAPKPRTEASVEAPENLQAASEGEQRSKRPRVTRELTFKESAERVAEVLSSPAYGRFGNIFSPANAFLGIPSSGATSSRAKPAEKELQSATASVQPAVGESVQSSENQAVSPENASDVGSKGAKKTLNYGAVVGLAARARQFPDDFVIRGDSLWCVSCHKPVTHERKSSVDSHLSSAAHKQAKAAKPPSVTQRSPSSTAPPLSSNAGTPVTPKNVPGQLKQADLKQMTSARLAINEARDDLVMAFTAAGIPIAKLEHPCIQGYLKKHTIDKGCYVKDDRTWQQCYPRITVSHFESIRSILQKAKFLAVSFDEWTDSRGAAILHIIVHDCGASIMVDAVDLQCKGPNDGVEHTEVASAVNNSLAKVGAAPEQVYFFIFDEGSVMTSAFNELSRFYKKAKKHICVAHKLDGAGAALTKNGFTDIDLLLGSPSLLNHKYHAARRRRWFAHLRNAKMAPAVPPKVGVTRWCSWRDATEWWRVYVTEWKKFLLQETKRTPWSPKQQGETPPLLHRLSKMLEERFQGVQIRLAFISEHTQKLSAALNQLQSADKCIAPFVYDMVMNVRDEYVLLSQSNADFAPSVEQLLEGVPSDAPIRKTLHEAAASAAAFINRKLDSLKGSPFWVCIPFSPFQFFFLSVMPKFLFLA